MMTLFLLTLLFQATTPKLVSKTVQVEAIVNDNSSCLFSVSIHVDGGPALGGSMATAPYIRAWDTTTVMEGLHTLTARATDCAGNMGESLPFTVSVDNQAPVLELFINGEKVASGPVDQKLVFTLPRFSPPAPTLIEVMAVKPPVHVESAIPHDVVIARDEMDPK